LLLKYGELHANYDVNYILTLEELVASVEAKALHI
jgi:hypothetical protein